MDMNIRYDGKVILITGGSSGIGLSCAELFGSLGAKVSICGTNPDKLQAAVDHLKEMGIETFGGVCKVEDKASLQKYADDTEAALGPIDIWVSNAAICPQKTILDTDDETWDRTIDINMKAVFISAKIAFEKMKDRGGNLLMASSFASLFPSVGSGVYAATKAAVSSMIKTLAAEMAPYGIRVNGYIPGVINTEMNRERLVRDHDALVAAIDLKCLGEPIDVAWSLAFLASDYARYITGTTIETSGGKMTVQNPMRAWENKAAQEQ